MRKQFLRTSVLAFIFFGIEGLILNPGSVNAFQCPETGETPPGSYNNTCVNCSCTTNPDKTISLTCQCLSRGGATVGSTLNMPETYNGEIANNDGKLQMGPV